MVTKLTRMPRTVIMSSVLAKIFMVTKRFALLFYHTQRSVLAKIFMVTKLMSLYPSNTFSSVLAKIFMVTKPQKYGSTFLNVIEY